MTLINCKGELILKWTKYYVFSAAGADNKHGNSNNIVFIIKRANLYVPIAPLSGKNNQKLSRLLSKTFEKSVYWN